MSMSTRIVFLRSADDPHYQKMLKALRSCKEAGVKIPDEVLKYFGDSWGDEEYPLAVDCDRVRPWSDEGASGVEFDVKDIPEGVKTIRFYNSW